MFNNGKAIRRALVAFSMFTFFAATARIDSHAENAAPAVVEVKIDNFAFAPDTLTVVPGTTVEWINRDDIPHTVVSEDKTTFKSKAMDTDESFSHTFDKPGTYTYFCSIHPKMVAKIVVK